MATERTPLICSPDGTSINDVPHHVTIPKSPDLPIPVIGIDRYLPFLNGKPFTHKIWNNVAAGVTVSLINIPLSISLAVASQTTPIAGVITALFAGMASALLGGSQYNIVGPTGALSGILARYVMMWGIHCLPTLAITSGFIMFCAFLFNWDKVVAFLPSGVNHGFTLGVAFIIAGGQIVPMFGLPPLPTHEYFFENLYESISHLYLADWYCFTLFLTCWVLLFTLVKKFPKIPWMVLISAIGIIIGYLSTAGYFYRFRTLHDKYGDLIPNLWQPVSWNTPELQPMWNDWKDVLIASMSIAFVGVLESLISGKIADTMTKSTMKQRQECLAVAIANVASGLAGGIPATAALARTALNIRQGATSRLAGLINGISSSIIALMLLPYFGYMPLCVVASLLFQVAIGMIETKHIVHAYHVDSGALMLTLLVAVFCLLLDPTMAIVIGAIVGLFRQAQAVANGYTEVTFTKDLNTGDHIDIQTFDAIHHESHEQSTTLFGKIGHTFDRLTDCFTSSSVQSVHENTMQLIEGLSDHTVIYRIVGDFTYVSALHHASRLKRLVNSKHIIISLRYCYYIDLDGLDALEETLTLLMEQEKTVFLTSLTPSVNALLSKTQWFQTLRSQKCIFDNVKEATDYLQGRVGEPVLGRRLSLDSKLA